MGQRVKKINYVPIVYPGPGHPALHAGQHRFTGPELVGGNPDGGNEQKNSIASPSSSPVQDTGLSRRQHRFKSGWGRQMNYRVVKLIGGLFFTWVAIFDKLVYLLSIILIPFWAGMSRFSFNLVRLILSVR